MGPEGYALYLLLILAIFSTQIHSFRFNVESGSTKCISEDIKGGAMTVGKYHAINPHEGHPLPDTHTFIIQVTSTYGNSYHYASYVSEGTFAFQTAESGDYTACFYAADNSPPITFPIELEWKSGVLTKDMASVVKKDSVEAMESQLRNMYLTVFDIQSEMQYLREREEEMQELNRSTNSSMGWLSGVSIIVVLSVAGMQYWHLKTYFQKKKLI
ncbi:PREDICTED: transmembrane emp24 domain-containing protein p24delta10-like [Ipomoea nil]|uniref:transmembrane emp24 domain-containing protein p24delta10-like n=1 Tax=Ipomoea nil TaxID=35883 RepID=UPI0009011D63|nr:PREDICTED: transmembrane emp24 domain-containing protein p24delta10-like [Ipomoea nil]